MTGGMTSDTARAVSDPRAIDPRVSEINGRVAALARARRIATDAASRVKQLREAFETSIAEDVHIAKQASATVEHDETALRAIVAEHYKLTADKRPSAGIEVKTRSTLRYDRDAAFAWAKETKMALVPESLDVKAFEKIAKATPLPFVQTVDEPMVTIATDLDKALAVAAVTSTDPSTSAEG
jgi:hypothetical protein